MTRLFLILTTIVVLWTSPATSKDLGRIGATFPIGEIDMLQWIEARLRHFDATGKLQEMQEEMEGNVRRSVETPAPLGLSTTTTPETFNVDPSLTLAKDLTDAQGKVFAKAGTRINPFDTRTWPQGATLPQFEYSYVLFFFDGRDAQQLALAKRFQSDKPIKWVLTGGSPNEVSRALNHRIYFDQQGDLSRQLRIKAVPSLVEQSGIHWQVTEFDVSLEEPDL